MLPYWYDVDTVAELSWVGLHCSVVDSGERPYRAPATLRLLQRLQDTGVLPKPAASDNEGPPAAISEE